MRSRRDYGSGSIERRSSQQWRVTLELPRSRSDGQRVRRRFTVRGTKRDAQQALREALGDRDRGVLIVGDPPTLGEWLPQWLQQHATDRDLAETTVVRYERVIRLGLLPVLGHARLDELGPQHFIAYQTAESITPDNRTRGIKLVKRALADAVIAGVIGRNPAQSIRSQKVRRRAERRALSDDEVRVLLQTAAGTSYWTPLALAVTTGLRQGELLALTWDDMELDLQRFTVHRGLRVIPGRGVQIAPAKTKNAVRTIEVSERMTALLRKHRVTQQETRLRLGQRWQANDFVFPSGVGTVWSPSNFYRGYRAIVGRSGLDRPATITFHTLRHTAATQQIRVTKDIHLVSRRLGHSSAAFTMDTYGHLLPGTQRVAAEALDHVIG